MRERYENWKDLKPLTAPVPVGTKCVVISAYKSFAVGTIVITLEESRVTMCKAQNGKTECMAYFELALLPSEEPAKVERKIVQISMGATESVDSVVALCSDGTLWSSVLTKYPEWIRLPPIPQDAV